MVFHRNLMKEFLSHTEKGTEKYIHIFQSVCLGIPTGV